MANNRMHLRCNVCKEEFKFANYFPTLTNGWVIRCDGTNFDQFLQQHSFCGNIDRNVGNIDFSLTFETTT